MRRMRMRNKLAALVAPSSFSLYQIAFDLLPHLQWHFELFDTLHAANLQTCILFVSLPPQFTLSLSIPSEPRSFSFACEFINSLFWNQRCIACPPGKRVSTSFYLTTPFSPLSLSLSVSLAQLLIECRVLFKSLAHGVLLIWSVWICLQFEMHFRLVSLIETINKCGKIFNCPINEVENYWILLSFRKICTQKYSHLSLMKISFEFYGPQLNTLYILRLSNSSILKWLSNPTIWILLSFWMIITPKCLYFPVNQHWNHFAKLTQVGNLISSHFSSYFLAKRHLASHKQCLTTFFYLHCSFLSLGDLFQMATNIKKTY